MSFLLHFKKYISIISIFLFLTSCGVFKPVSTSRVPVDGKERAKKNIAEGRGVSIKSLKKGMSGGGQYEFSTSNPMWRASLDVLDFMPLTTIDYSGGMIISDWYQDTNDTKNSLKITVRFLSNQVAANSLKVIVHQRTCVNLNNCTTGVLKNSKINEELSVSIIKKAAIIEKEQKK
jgi:hypothetical protein|tara:strand:- start:429 stop:956 length:528 start_codon:yes stop_codon:yes gene_type:complete